MQVKLFIFLAFLILFSNSIAQAQACGRSVRTIELEFAEKVEKPEKVSYELFYVAPKIKSVNELWDEKTTKFVSKFYYGNPKKEKFQFWQTTYGTTEFLEVPKEKAEKYLQNYKLEDFKLIYEDDFHNHHLSQLNGEFKDNKLKLKTSEMDNTPFLLKVSAKGFDTQYYLADFLGGCHRRDKRIIKMNLAK